MSLHRHHTSRKRDVCTITQTSYLTVRERCLYHYTDIVPHERDVHYTDIMPHDRDVYTTTHILYLTREVSIPLHRHHTSRERDVYTTTQTSYLTVRERCLYHYTDIMPHDRDVYTTTQTSYLTRQRCLYHYTDITAHERDVNTTTQTSYLTTEMSISLHRHHAS